MDVITPYNFRNPSEIQWQKCCLMFRVIIPGDEFLNWLLKRLKDLLLYKESTLCHQTSVRRMCPSTSEKLVTVTIILNVLWRFSLESQNSQQLRLDSEPDILSPPASNSILYFAWWVSRALTVVNAIRFLRGLPGVANTWLHSRDWT